MGARAWKRSRSYGPRDGNVRDISRRLHARKALYDEQDLSDSESKKSETPSFQRKLSEPVKCNGELPGSCTLRLKTNWKTRDLRKKRDQVFLLDRNERRGSRVQGGCNKEAVEGERSKLRGFSRHPNRTDHPIFLVRLIGDLLQ